MHKVTIDTQKIRELRKFDIVNLKSLFNALDVVHFDNKSLKDNHKK